MVDQRKTFSLTYSPDHCQRSGFEPAQNLSSDLVEWCCAVVITTGPRCHNGFMRFKFDY